MHQKPVAFLTFPLLSPFLKLLTIKMNTRVFFGGLYLSQLRKGRKIRRYVFTPFIKRRFLKFHAVSDSKEPTRSLMYFHTCCSAY